MSQRKGVLLGYDTKGSVYAEKDAVIRQINDNYLEEAKKLYSVYSKNQLDKMGIVESEFRPEEKIFRHKKYPITYPYEWTANMLKDAALLHLSLFAALDKFDYTLKDALPNNVVFNFTEPKFIDFFSILPTDNLKDESWLTDQARNDEDLRYTVIRQMFVPFFLIPIAALAKKDYRKARRILIEKICNCTTSSPTWRDIFPHTGYRGFGLHYAAAKMLSPVTRQTPRKWLSQRQLSSLLQLLKNNKLDFVDFANQLIGFISALDVTPLGSTYSSYYQEKQEDFDLGNSASWQNKQRGVHKIIKETKPKRVLDLGANTGWFSIIAAKLGSEVIATDIDEASIDSLYLHAKKEKLPILPLYLSFDDLTREIYGLPQEGESEDKPDFSKHPLYFAATKRLKSDLVLCLGLIHHLTLGLGKSLEETIKTLAELANQTLVIEFVDLDDDKITSEPTFFGSLDQFNSTNYSQELAIKIGKKYFKEVEILDSQPETRKLLVFKR